jgi:hypothetical protein
MKTRIKAGWDGTQHNETLARGLRLETAVKAGGIIHD